MSAVLAQVFLLEWGNNAGRAQLPQFRCIARPGWWWRQCEPAQTTRGDVITAIAQHPQKSVVAVGDQDVIRLDVRANGLPYESPDDVGVYQASDFGFTFCDILIQTSIFERTRGLRGEQLEYDGPRLHENAWRQVVFQIEHAPELGLRKQRQTQH